MTSIKYYKTSPRAVFKQATPLAEGYDLAAVGDVTLEPQQTVMVPLGVHVAIPTGRVGLLVPRSSLYKRGLVQLNRVGVIDSDYRGELKEVLCNISTGRVTLSAGERICQLVIVDTCIATSKQVEKVEELGDTERGEGGFGSTGRGSR